MPVQETSTNSAPPVVVASPEGDEEQLRKLAVEQIERKRRFYMRAFGAAAVAALLVIWAIAEYHNADGWPTNGFSQSSGIYHTWNSWIIYPIIALGFGVAIDWWRTFQRRPISEDEIRREIDHLRGGHYGGGES